MSRFHWACFTKPTFSRLKKDFVHLSWTRLWLEPLPGWLTLGREPWNTLQSPAYAGFRYAGITMFVLPICWSRAWGALEKNKKKGSLNLSDDNFHQEREVKAPSSLQLMQAAPAWAGVIWGKRLSSLEGGCFSRQEAMSCISAVRSAHGTAGEAALPAQPLCTAAAVLNAPCEGLAVTKILCTTVYYSISYSLTRKRFLQYTACSLATDQEGFWL